jgi:hypothetical protein
VTRAEWHATAADHGRGYVGRHRTEATREPWRARAGAAVRRLVGLWLGVRR